jgi:hypothetical protein
MRAFGVMQRKKVVILNSDPRRCGEILASSDTKGTFLERIFATPAWHPVYSIESMDGERWEQLSHDFKKLMAALHWRERLAPLAHRHAAAFEGIVDSEAICRLTVRILFELLFDQPMSSADETLFYQASLEWRKEIALKGKADEAVKAAFWSRLTAHVAASQFKEGLESYKADPSCWLSLFAQPFLISPQINISDIFVAVFHYLRLEPGNMDKARCWAAQDDRARLGGILLESIRLRHPFPILEREVGDTHFFILMDQFQQDQNFRPERWLAPAEENPYHAIPFAAGPRMCVGKPIAMELMVELLKAFVALPDEQVQPQRGHLYSGRDNDGRAVKGEGVYQARAFSQGLWRSFVLGLRKKKPLPAQCVHGHKPTAAISKERASQAFQNAPGPLL